MVLITIPYILLPVIGNRFKVERVRGCVLHLKFLDEFCDDILTVFW